MDETETQVQTNTGTGDGVTTPQTEATPQQAQHESPFDFSAINDGDGVTTPQPEDGASPEQGGKPEEDVYTLDLADSPYDGGQEITDMVTSAAKASGLSASAASEFVKSVCKGLSEQEQAAEKQAVADLQKEWGASYDTNMKETGKFLKGMAQRLGFSDGEASKLMNSTVFRLVNALRQQGTERAALGTGASDAVSKQQKLDALMSDPATRDILADPFHHDYAKTAALANSYMPTPVF